MNEINNWIREDYLHQLCLPSRRFGMKKGKENLP